MFMRRLVSAILIGFLISSTIFSLSTQLIKAADTTWSQTIQINADGSITPSDAPIHRNGNLYTLTEDISFTSDEPSLIISIEKSYIILDGAQHVIRGGGLDRGIKLEGQQNVTIKNTKILGCAPCIVLIYCSGINIYSNDMANDGRYTSGISIGYSNYNTFLANNITYNYYYGVGLVKSNFNNFIGNNITHGSNIGISLDAASSNNVFAENNISHVNYLQFSANNKIFHNNFGNIYSIQTSGENFWDDGYPSGGNYWNDYVEPDLNHDGIGDTQYTIDENNVDHYPLINPWTPPVEVDIDIKPHSLKLGANNKMVTCSIKLPSGLETNTINEFSVRLNDAVSASSATEFSGSHGKNSFHSATITFKAEQVKQYLINSGNVPEKSDILTLTINGRLSDGTLFEGSSTIRVSK